MLTYLFQLERVRQLNALDAELYDFATQILQERFELLKDGDPDFSERWQRIIQPHKSLNATAVSPVD